LVTFENKRDQILADGRTFSESVSIRNCNNCQLVNCKFDGTDSKDGDKLLDVRDVKNCKFIKCEFFGKKNGGLCLNLTGAKSDGNEVTDCYWHDIASTTANGAEPFRIGNSNLSHCWLNTKVENCRFENIKTTEPELISIKSCGNWILNSQIKNCTCDITVRHGHTNTIQGGTIEGDCGIRVHGKSNKIDGVKFKNNKHSKRVPIRICNGDTEIDPNEKAGIALGTANKSGHATYTQVKGGSIINCVFENCLHPVKWGERDNKFKPGGVKFVDNHYLADKVECTVIEFSHGATEAGNVFQDNTYEGKVKIPSKIADGFKKGKDNVPEPDHAPDPEPEEPTGEPIVEPPPQPEENPAEQPADEPPKYARVCQVDGQEEGKKVVGVWLCPEDAELIRPMMQQWWSGIRAAIKSGEIKPRVLIDQEDNA